MSHHLDHQKNREQDARARQAMEIQTSLFKRALRQALDHPETRLILWEFLQQMGWDQSPFSGNGPAQAHAIGKQDAARWWLNAIREHCPEREQQIRNEGVARDKQAKNTAITEEESE